MPLLLVLGQLALAWHQIEHRLEQIGHDEAPCGVCAIADHLGGAPEIVALAPSGIWDAAGLRPVYRQLRTLSRPDETRARAPPVSLA